MKERILLVDGHSILNRAFYGLPVLTNSKGVHTNAVYGFVNILFKELEELEPSYLAVAFDMPGPTFRHVLYESYKGTRKPMPAELAEQVPLIKELLSAMNIKIFGIEGIEADDLIGSAARLAEEQGLEVYILSGDRDLLQLVTANITLKLPRTSKGNTVIETFTPEKVKEEYNVDPIRIIDLKAMMGDASDNIPGLPGIGEKTASNLLATYGSLENAHEHFEEITPKKARESMRDNYELALISKELATIKTDADLGSSISELRMGNIFTDDAYKLFKELEFKNHFHRFDDRKTVSAEFEIIDNKESAEKAIGQVIKSGASAFYLDIRDKEIKGTALAFDDKVAYIKKTGSLTDSYIIQAVNTVISGAADISTYRFKDQQKILKSSERKDMFDCEIAAYLEDPLKNEYTYDYIFGKFANGTLPSVEEIVQEKITKKTVFTEEQLITVAVYKALSALRSKKGLINALQNIGMEKLFYEIEMPLTYTLSDMENEGIAIDASQLKSFSVELGEKIKEIEQKIYLQAGEEFNIQSPKQLGVILFEKMKLSGAKKTKTGYSTAADVLEKLSENVPIAADILEYRQLSKLKSTYADTLSDYADENGRIHSHFLQSVTATGRLSSADPNLQNIPVRMDIGKRIRKVFIAKRDHVFIDADYSQIELRVLAHFANDEKLIEAYKMNSDIHRITASQVFGVDFDEVTPIQRRNAKAVNFGIVYGISSFGLSQGLSISRKEAQGYIEKYFMTYPGIKKYLDETVMNAKKTGFTTTMFGRRRPIPELSSPNFMQRQFGERIAMNSPIQGSAADIIKIAMNNVRQRLKKEGFRAKLILQVHDELLIEAPVREAEAVSAILKEEMENAAALKVPLIIDLKTGTDWYETH